MKDGIITREVVNRDKRKAGLKKEIKAELKEGPKGESKKAKIKA